MDVLLERSLLEAIGISRLVSYLCWLPILAVAWWLVIRKKTLHLDPFVLIAIVIFLSIFIPYFYYLFFVSALFSVIIGGTLLLIRRWKRKKFQQAGGNPESSSKVVITIASALLIIMSIGEVLFSIDVISAIVDGSHSVVAPLALKSDEMRERQTILYFASDEHLQLWLQDEESSKFEEDLCYQITYYKPLFSNGYYVTTVQETNQGCLFSR